MDNSGKIKSVIISNGMEQYAEHLSNELKEMDGFVFIGRRKDDNPKGRWMTSSTMTGGPQLAEAFANFMCLSPLFAQSVIFAVHKYRSIHNLGEVTLKGERKKAYISLPITGYDIEERKAVAEAARQFMKEVGAEAVTPFDFCDDPNLSYAHCMGRDIEALLGCKFAVFLPDWRQSRGCRLEHYAAKIYGIPTTGIKDYRLIDRFLPDKYKKS